MSAPFPQAQKSARSTRGAVARALSNFPKIKTGQELKSMGIELEPIEFKKKPPALPSPRIGRGGAKHIIPEAVSQEWVEEPEDKEYITLGMSAEGKTRIDLEILMRSRMLITASSGGGKSWAVRRLLEETCNEVQQIIIDPEGEFDTLSEIFPYAVFNERNAEMPLSKSSPFALAQEIVKGGVSSILDLSEIDPDARQHFVKWFIKGLMELDKEHWRHVIVVLDEAHIFAPQQEKADAKKSVIDLATRGRKRGYCPVLATQRFSMLNKSVVAELQNRMIGQTGLDIDLRRASTELGMSILTTTATLTALEPGNFLIYGPALSKTVTRMRVGPVRTRHGIQLGSIRRPAQCSEAFMSAICTAAKAPEEETNTDGENKKDLAPKAKAKLELVKKRKISDDKLKYRIAHKRVGLVLSILRKKSPAMKAKAIQKAAEKANVSTATIYTWMNQFDQNDPINSLMPKRLPRAA